MTVRVLTSSNVSQEIDPIEAAVLFGSTSAELSSGTVASEAFVIWLGKITRDTHTRNKSARSDGITLLGIETKPPATCGTAGRPAGP